MPIYEFYCKRCHTLFNFFSKTINTTKCPECPACKTVRLERQISMFAMTGQAKEEGGMDDLPLDDSRMERAMESLASEAESIKEDDPRQAANLMRKFSKMTGIEFGKGMQEALNRLEGGEDPERIESEMGDLLENEDPFLMPEKTGAAARRGRGEPRRDKTLYEM